MSTTPVQELPRRRLSTKRSLTVDRLTDAAVDELHATGYSGLTVRAVAARCGVAPATAYNYFSSKEHLIAEVFWRRISAQDESAPQGPAGWTRRLVVPRRRARATEVLANFALVVSNETERPPPAPWRCWWTTPRCTSCA